VVVANRVQPAAQQELSRKDFESSIERKVDFVVPFDAKLAAQAAKLGKPLAEVAKNQKAMAPLGEIADLIAACADSDDMPVKRAGAGKGSLMDKIGALKAKLPSKKK
jgi:pilus assembly protein CpaE